MAADKKNWSKQVWDTSDALGFPAGLFTGSAYSIARGLAEAGRNRHNHPGTPGKKKSTAKTDFQAAMCMLNYYINRAGKKLSLERRQELERAKNYLRKEFGKPLKLERKIGEEED